MSSLRGVVTVPPLCFTKPTACASLRAKATAMEKQVLQEQLFSESLPTAKDVQNGVLFRRECGKLMGVLRSSHGGSMMYGLRSDLDLSFLVGPTLLQVCIGENEVVLRFDGNISITIESRFLVRDLSGHDTVFENAPPAAALLVEFLPDSITSSYPAPPSGPRAYEQYE